MRRFRTLIALGLCGPIFAAAGCSTGYAPPPPPVVRPAAFTPLGLGASYLAATRSAGKRRGPRRCARPRFAR